MDITRVDQDGVEFFTANPTGESGMSITGIAQTIGLSRPRISQLIKAVEETSPLVREDEKNSSEGLPDIWSDLVREEEHVKDETLRSHFPSKQLEPFYGNVPLVAEGGRINGKNVGNLKIYRHDFCAAMIRHFAYRKYAKAQYFLDKFSDLGMLTWIQGITGWKPAEVQTEPEILIPDVNIPHNVIQALTSQAFSPTAYRLCLNLHQVGQQGERPTVKKICRDLKISRPTYHKTVHRLNKYNLLPSWFEIESRNYPERMVRDWLHSQLGGQIEAPTIYGPIDLLTDCNLIEVKAIEDWKDALGHVMVKGLLYPKHFKAVMLFGDKAKDLTLIRDACEALDVSIGFQLIKYIYDDADEILEIQRQKIFC